MATPIVLMIIVLLLAGLGAAAAVWGTDSSAVSEPRRSGDPRAI
jgi:hypothetical protein